MHNVSKVMIYIHILSIFETVLFLSMLYVCIGISKYVCLCIYLYMCIYIYVCGNCFYIHYRTIIIIIMNLNINVNDFIFY